LISVKLRQVNPLSAGGGKMAAMSSPSKTIPIQNAAPAASGCGACLHGTDSGPVCHAVADRVGGAPRLSGPDPDVQRLLAALAPALGFADPLGSGIVRALQVGGDEVELQLAVSRHCGGALLADAAFQALRGLLPDTDIYVTTAD